MLRPLAGFISKNVGGDPNFSSVVALVINDNAANNSTTFTDQSSSANTFTAGGGAKYSNAQAPTGMTTSAVFSGGGGDKITSAHVTNYDLPGDFTAEWMVRFTDFSDYRPTFERGHTSAAGILIQHLITGGSASAYFDGTLNATEVANAPSTGVWYHYALVRSGSTVTLYRAGVSVGSWTSSANINSNSILSLGADDQGPAKILLGYMSNFRLTKGVARYTTTFTPPSLPFPNH